MCEVGPFFRATPETRTWTRTWTRNLDKFYRVFSSCRATCPSLARELGQGTWTTAGCRVTMCSRLRNKAAGGCPSSLSKFPGRTWTSGFARGKHVIKFVQVPCPSSCPSSGPLEAAGGWYWITTGASTTTRRWVEGGSDVFTLTDLVLFRKKQMFRNPCKKQT